MTNMSPRERFEWKTGIYSSTALYNLGLTREHAYEVYFGREPMSDDEMRLIHQVFLVPMDDLLWLNQFVAPTSLPDADAARHPKEG